MNSLMVRVTHRARECLALFKVIESALGVSCSIWTESTTLTLGDAHMERKKKGDRLGRPFNWCLLLYGGT